MPYVTDTHSLVWYITDRPEISAKAKSIFQSVDDSHDQIFIPCIVFFEILYLVEKKKIPVDFDGLVSMVNSSKNYRIEPLCLPIISKSKIISREKTKDPWDRLIAATSLHLGFPLITRDRILSNIDEIKTIW